MWHAGVMKISRELLVMMVGTVMSCGKVRAAVPDALQAAAVAQEKTLAAARRVGEAWMEAVRSGDYAGGMKLWGYQAFEKVARTHLEESLRGQSRELGELQVARLLEDRSVLDGEGPAEAPGSYVTLRWFARYGKKAQREFLVVHEPAQDGDGMRIIGLRREDLPAGKEGTVELAADLGMAGLLRLRGVAESKWRPYVEEAEALAAGMKLALPPLPPVVPGVADREAREKAGADVVAYLMDGLNPMLEKIGDAQGRREARMVLTSYAMLMLYKPGEETMQRLGAVIGADGAKSGLPAGLWQPVVRAVVDKEPAERVYELVQSMVSDVALHLRHVENEQAMEGNARELLDKAFQNMASLPSYEVRAEFRAGEKRAKMEAALTLEAAEIRLTGFDGVVQLRLAGRDGFWMSSDGGKTWRVDSDHETATGLLRTLTAPVDPGFKVTGQHEFVLAGEEVIDGEKLIRVRSREATVEAPLDYWILISKAGPVVRRAEVILNFGELPAVAKLTYTRLGRPVQITKLETRETPAGSAESTGSGGR